MSSSSSSSSTELCTRAWRYIEGLEATVGKLSLPESSKLNVNRLLDAVQRYLSDAKYFANTGDCATALISVSYAEGLLDALRYLGVSDVPWSKIAERPRVLVAGTFDILHPGHIELLKFAASHGRVYVIVSRDRNARKSKKRPLVLNENVRVKLVSSIRYVYEARLGHEEDYIKPLEDIRPDIIVLGPDQPFDEEELADIVEKRIGKRPLVIRFKSKLDYDGIRGSTDIILRICNNLCPLLNEKKRGSPGE
jgi:FAD synthetase